MGTTADKLAYLEGTKAAIREAITAKGVDLPEDTAFRDYAGKIEGISTGASPLPLDPLEVYRSQRPPDWLPMPEPEENEIYLLFHVPDMLEGYELSRPTGRIYFTVTCTGSYTVERGTVTDGVFTPDSAAEVLASGSMYSGCFTGLDGYECTSDGMCQIMFRVSGTDIQSWETGMCEETTYYGVWNIVDIACRLPSCSHFACGSAQLQMEALTSLRYFAWYGGNKLKDMTGMFGHCQNLQAVLALDTSGVTDMTRAFLWCCSLIALPDFDTGSLRSLQRTFMECHSLYAPPELDTHLVEDLAFIFCNCHSLRSLYWLDTSSATTLECAFYGCESLRAIRPIALTGYPVEGGMNGTFAACYSLQHLEFDVQARPEDWSGDDIYFGDSPFFHEDLTALLDSLPDITSTSPGQHIIELNAIPGTQQLTEEEDQAAAAKGWVLLY